ncbi:hypothetical protein T4D_12511 [Trichinella pseudospiralis]|uniref:Uncharacterized protein n=1 Tax=Trichinella pseudospiralis TaxID=6337 RepID=A0A0V1FV49_TRIPS|nr:hypothetical protein T4D_12511 [Trichinella pseudospiralis]
MKIAEKNFNVVKLVKSGQQQKLNLEQAIASHVVVLAKTVCCPLHDLNGHSTNQDIFMLGHRIKN